MNILNIIFGILLILLGFLIIWYYEKSIKKEGLSFKIRTAGIGLVIIGIGLILREFEMI